MQDHVPIPLIINRIVLMGFMGAGKSTVGARLARRLRWQFADSDVQVEQVASSTIADIFREQGETHFRELESEAVRSLATRSQVVLALGGGAIEMESTRAILANSGDSCLIFLDAPFEVMVARCRHEKVTVVRPLLNDEDSLHKRLTRRLPHYRAAHLTIATGGSRPDEIVDRILYLLRGSRLATPLKEDAPA